MPITPATTQTLQTIPPPYTPGPAAFIGQGIGQFGQGFMQGRLLQQQMKLQELQAAFPSLVKMGMIRQAKPGERPSFEFGGAPWVTRQATPDMSEQLDLLKYRLDLERLDFAKDKEAFRRYITPEQLGIGAGTEEGAIRALLSPSEYLGDAYQQYKRDIFNPSSPSNPFSKKKGKSDAALRTDAIAELRAQGRQVNEKTIKYVMELLRNAED